MAGLTGSDPPRSQFAVRYAPLYQRRSDIVAGASEPTEAELSAGADEDDEAESASITEGEDKGIPDFWLVALRHHVGISELSASRRPLLVCPRVRARTVR